MRRTALFVLVFLLPFVVSGCSTVEDFFVVNSSDSKIEVSVKWRDNLYSGLQKYKFERFDGKKFERIELGSAFTSEEIGKAEEKNEILVVLQPREMLRVHGVLNKSREEIANKVDESFHIEYLSLKGTKGNIEMSGEQAWYQFRELGQGHFIIYR